MDKENKNDENYYKKITKRLDELEKIINELSEDFVLMQLDTQAIWNKLEKMD